MTTKVLLTIPLRLIPGILGLSLCGVALGVGVLVKTICEPMAPMIDHEYRTLAGDRAINVVLLHHVKWWCKWIVYGYAS